MFLGKDSHSLTLHPSVFVWRWVCSRLSKCVIQDSTPPAASAANSARRARAWSSRVERRKQCVSRASTVSTCFKMTHPHFFPSWISGSSLMEKQFYFEFNPRAFLLILVLSPPLRCHCCATWLCPPGLCFALNYFVPYISAHTPFLQCLA